jgi:Flp pilus assembly protein TadG
MALRITDPFCASRNATRARPDEHGGALTEFGFVVTIFLTILLGIVGFGDALYAYHFISHSAREATRYAAVRGYTCNTDADGGSCQASNSASGIAGPTTTADVTTFVKNMAPGGIKTANITVTACGVSGATACGQDTLTICTAAVGGVGPYPNYPGCVVEVQVQYNFSFIIPLISTKTLTMTSSSYLTILH